MICGRVFSWGESQLINTACANTFDERQVLHIEMQSEDEMRVAANAFSFLVGEPVG